MLLKVVGWRSRCGALLAGDESGQWPEVLVGELRLMGWRRRPSAWLAMRRLVWPAVEEADASG
jgi:hypothetical protein